MERDITLSETDTFVVDEAWLKRESAAAPSQDGALSALEKREVEMIETALAETGWTKGTVQRAFYGQNARPALPKNV